MIQNSFVFAQYILPFSNVEKMTIVMHLTTARMIFDPHLISIDVVNR